MIVLTNEQRMYILTLLASGTGSVSVSKIMKSRGINISHCTIDKMRKAAGLPAPRSGPK